MTSFLGHIELPNYLRSNSATDSPVRKIHTNKDSRSIVSHDIKNVYYVLNLNLDFAEVALSANLGKMSSK